ncbi:MAG TPA: prepilin-type N-terminal cleavage/methylation domain-containing protein [Kiritimatiellia bacterium]|nr:prepilin-type N-terminal cleavage/methylation domain-containing protein [Kiritimatiellia bacterium]HSA16786.1 prepilin-type N-terminal cleavage/methylation domain-containing protein [Kiritimatiellia bacterium]
MRKTETQRRGRSGFTLVEVMIAVVLVLLALGGAYTLIVHSARVSRAARDHYVAVNLAKNHLERARNFRYADLYLLAEDNLVMNENGGPDNRGRFRRTTVVDDDYATGVTEITVTVQVRNRRTGEFGEEKEQISSLFTEYLTPEIE